MLSDVISIRAADRANDREQQPVQPLAVRPARCRRRPVLCPVPCMAPLMPLEMPWVLLAMQLVALQGRTGGR